MFGSRIKNLAGIWARELPLGEIEKQVAQIQSDHAKAESQLLKLVRSNITLKNDGAMLAIINAIPSAIFDNNKTPAYQAAVEDAKMAIRLKVISIVEHEEELQGLSIDQIVLSKDTRTGIQYIIDMLKERDKFVIYGVDFPTGALFSGPPGVGKTEVARLIAKENQGNFIQVKSSDIIHGIVGASEKAITKMFEDAKKHALGTGVCVMFIDEAENILRDRKQQQQHSNVAHFLGQVDGFQKNRGVFIILGTNIPGDIDPAVLSRMSQKIEFQLPDTKQIKNIFAIHFLSKIPSGPIKKTLKEFLGHKEDELNQIYEAIFQKKGSGRDIKNICEAAKIRFMLRHIRDSSTDMKIEDIQQGMETVFSEITMKI